jgi:nitrogen fixation NifU-like protein
MDLYAENILDHFRHPRNYGKPLEATVEHEEVNLACGDALHLWLKIAGSSEKSQIVDVGWTGTGCAISQASMSLLSEELRGMEEEQVLQLRKEDIHALLGVPIGPRRIKCALMSLHCLKNAFHKAMGSPLQSWLETVALEREEENLAFS